MKSQKKKVKSPRCSLDISSKGLNLCCLIDPETRCLCCRKVWCYQCWQDSFTFTANMPATWNGPVCSGEGHPILGKHKPQLYDET